MNEQGAIFAPQPNATNDPQVRMYVLSFLKGCEWRRKGYKMPTPLTRIQKEYRYVSRQSGNWQRNRPWSLGFLDGYWYADRRMTHAS